MLLVDLFGFSAGLLATLGGVTLPVPLLGVAGSLFLRLSLTVVLTLAVAVVLVGALLVTAFTFSFDVVLVLIAGAICLVVIADFVDGFVDGFAGVLTTLAATGGA